jgi:microcystin-dependent protein
VALETKVGVASSSDVNSHEYKLSGLTGGETAISINDLPEATVVTKSSLGLGNVDNTSDTAKLSAFLLVVYPVGSIYTNINSTDPGTLFGGTWVAFGAGKVLTGYNGSDTDFNASEKTGGNKTTTLGVPNLPAHHHNVDPPSTATDTQGAHVHSLPNLSLVDTSGTRALSLGSVSGTSNTGNTGAHNHWIDIAAFDSGDTGSGTAFSNLIPYITVYFFKRTA